MNQLALDDFSSSGVECPTCGRDDFASEGGMKSHHAQVHGESIAGIQATCELCGEDFKYPNDRPGRFCSVECRTEAQRNRVTITCSECGDEFDRTPSSVHEERNFCSNECQYASRSRRPKEDHPSWLGDRIQRECKHCGDEFESPPSNRGRTTFCSNECMWSHRRQKSSWGSITTAVRNRISNRGWTSIAGEYRSDSDEECEMCGATTEKYGQKHDVHHVVPVVAGGVNSHELLMQLCRGCHEKAEKRVMELPEVEPLLTE